jgi:hypothetical protein
MFNRNKKLLSVCLSISLFLSVFSFTAKAGLAQQPTQENSVGVIKSWFAQYDQMRRAAQMSPAERQQADQILSKGLALFMPGQDKILAQKLLIDLVKRYDIACHQLSSLQIIPATEQLHRRYYQYFVDRASLILPII